jgi:RimJ/RimL family protein N-acetyltransferase
VKISSLSLADVASYRRLSLESIVQSPTSFFPSHQQASEASLEEMRARIEPTSLQMFFGAFDADKLVGMVGMLREPHAKTRHAANIISVYVTPEYRARGIAKSLVETVISQAKSNPEIVQLTICVNTANIIARSLYAKLGFFATGIDKRRLYVDGQFHDEERMILIFNN